MKSLQLFSTQLLILLHIKGYMQDSVEVCGKRTVKSGLIWHGEPSFPGEFPWHAAIFHFHIVNRHNKIYKCGGSLLNSDTVVTAAHCMYEEHQTGSIIPGRLLVRLGTNNINSHGSDIQDFLVFCLIKLKIIFKLKAIFFVATGQRCNYPSRVRRNFSQRHCNYSSHESS